MKTTFFILMISFNNFNPGPTCSDLRTGKFKLVSEDSGTTIITRTEYEQVEINKDLDVKMKYKVKWLNECTYQLFDAKIYKGEDYFKGNDTDTLTVEITDISDGFYSVMTSANFTDFSVEAKLEIIKLK